MISNDGPNRGRDRMDNGRARSSDNDPRKSHPDIRAP